MIRITDDKKFKTVKVTVDWMLNMVMDLELKDR